MSEMDEFNKIRKLFKKRGWKERITGPHYINGEIATHFIKDGNLLMVAFNIMPDEELVEELFGDNHEDS